MSLTNEQLEEIRAIIGGAYPDHWYYDEAFSLLTHIEELESELNGAHSMHAETQAAFSNMQNEIDALRAENMQLKHNQSNGAYYI